MFENVLCYICKDHYIEEWFEEEWLCDPCEIELFGKLG